MRDLEKNQRSSARKLTASNVSSGSSSSPGQHAGNVLASNANPLSRAFFDRDTRIVARELLGKLLIRRHGRRILAGRIVETEAYLGEEDMAAHAAVGKTARNAVLFGPPGFAYIYFIYGNHYCLNVSCLPSGVAGGVLFRALEPLVGLEEMARFRHIPLPPEPKPSMLRLLTTGPGRLAQAFGITRLRDNGKDLTDPRRSDLWLADDNHIVERILETPRIGITKSVEHPLRYVVAGSRFLSGKRTDV